MTKEQDIILVIDDEIEADYSRHFFQKIENMIFSLKFRHVFVASGDAGIAAVKKDIEAKKIKLILLDNEFRGQKLQGREILESIRTLRSDVPIIMFSQLSKGGSDKEPDRDNNHHPTSKTARRLGAVAYIEKEAFENTPVKVKNEIKALLQKKSLLKTSEVSLLIDCNDKSIDIIEDGASLLSQPVIFRQNKISATWKSDNWPTSEDHFLFKLLYALANKKPDFKLPLSEVFHLAKGREDSSKGKGSFTYIVPLSFPILISVMQDTVIFSETDIRRQWAALIDNFIKDFRDFDLNIIKTFIEKGKPRGKEALLAALSVYEKDINSMMDDDEIAINKLKNEFNEKIKNLSSGRILSLLGGSGPGRHREGQSNIISLSIDSVIIKNYSDEADEIITDNTASSFDDSKWVTKEEFIAFKKEILHSISQLISTIKK